MSSLLQQLLFCFVFHFWTIEWGAVCFQFHKITQFIACMLVHTAKFAKPKFGCVTFKSAQLVGNVELVCFSVQVAGLRSMLYHHFINQRMTTPLEKHKHNLATTWASTQNFWFVTTLMRSAFICLILPVSTIVCWNYPLIPDLAPVLKKARKCLGRKWATNVCLWLLRWVSRYRTTCG